MQNYHIVWEKYTQPNENIWTTWSNQSKEEYKSYFKKFLAYSKGGNKGENENATL